MVLIFSFYELIIFTALTKVRPRFNPGGMSVPYRCESPHQVGFLRRYDLKTGIHFAHFGLESGMVFEGTTGVNERMYPFNSK